MASIINNIFGSFSLKCCISKRNKSVSKNECSETGSVIIHSSNSGSGVSEKTLSNNNLLMIALTGEDDITLPDEDEDIYKTRSSMEFFGYSEKYVRLLRHVYLSVETHNVLSTLPSNKLYIVIREVLRSQEGRLSPFHLNKTIILATYEEGKNLGLRRALFYINCDNLPTYGYILNNAETRKGLYTLAQVVERISDGLLQSYFPTFDSLPLSQKPITMEYEPLDDYAEKNSKSVNKSSGKDNLVNGDEDSKSEFSYSKNSYAEDSYSEESFFGHSVFGDSYSEGSSSEGSGPEVSNSEDSDLESSAPSSSTSISGASYITCNTSKSQDI